MKTNTVQIIQKYKKNLIKYPVVNLPINELTKLTITNKEKLMNLIITIIGAQIQTINEPKFKVHK